MSNLENGVKTGGFASTLRNGIVKKIVNLKRKPQIIPLVLLFISCIIYTFNLTCFSDVTYFVTIGADANKVTMEEMFALYVFLLTLFSILNIVSYLNAYPKGKRNILMLVVSLVMLAAQLVLDFVCLDILNRNGFKNDPAKDIIIAKAINTTVIHIVSLVISSLAVVLLPLYHKLILMIPTQVDDEEGDNLDDAAEITSEDDLEDDDL